MKGILYYSKKDVKRNTLFIEDLTKEANKIGIQLDLVTKNEIPHDYVDFILFRGRDFDFLKQLEDSGFTTINPSEVNRIANHKLRTYEFATLLGVPAIPTKRFRSTKDINCYPAIVKTADGHGGDEVFFIAHEEKANRIVQRYKDRELVVQPYVKTGATDVRVFVLGNEIIGAVKRTGVDHFKSNYTLGGKIEKYELSRLEIAYAKTIAKALNSDYIGIDFLLSEDGSFVLNEIEDPVGARSLYLTHDFSVAEKLMCYIKNKVKK